MKQRRRRSRRILMTRGLPVLTRMMSKQRILMTRGLPVLTRMMSKQRRLMTRGLPVLTMMMSKQKRLAWRLLFTDLGISQHAHMNCAAVGLYKPDTFGVCASPAT